MYAILNMKNIKQINEIYLFKSKSLEMFFLCEGNFVYDFKLFEIFYSFMFLFMIHNKIKKLYCSCF